MHGLDQTKLWSHSGIKSGLVSFWYQFWCHSGINSDVILGQFWDQFWCYSAINSVINSWVSGMLWGESDDIWESSEKLFILKRLRSTAPAAVMFHKFGSAVLQLNLTSTCLTFFVRLLNRRASQWLAKGQGRVLRRVAKRRELSKSTLGAKVLVSSHLMMGVKTFSSTSYILRARKLKEPSEEMLLFRWTWGGGKF